MLREGVYLMSSPEERAEWRKMEDERRRLEEEEQWREDVLVTLRDIKNLLNTRRVHD